MTLQSKTQNEFPSYELSVLPLKLVDTPVQFPLTGWTTGAGLKSLNMSSVGSSFRLWAATGATEATGGWFSEGGRKGVGNFFGGVRTAEGNRDTI